MLSVSPVRSLWARDVAGVKLPDTAYVEGKPLNPNGMAQDRKVLFDVEKNFKEQMGVGG